MSNTASFVRRSGKSSAILCPTRPPLSWPTTAKESKPKSVHDRGLIPGHGPLGVGGMVLFPKWLGAVTIAPEVYGHNSKLLRQTGCHKVPHCVGLRVAVQ